MSTTRTATAVSTARYRRARAFTGHYLEMVIAMVVGMIALGPVWSWVLERIGATELFSRPDLAAIVMATDMTIAMSAWMRFRGHGWAPITEMAAAMYLPFILLFVPLWAGLISAATLMVAGHLLMLLAMAGVMLLRVQEYTHAHHTHHVAQQA
ncbi:hypothetical protein QYM41_10475 [Kocuria sp. CPCC 205268]|uniref:hypothetical protein n=1 Tax=Kocuria oxytropis TaxID=3058913 RepID=UPI0034D6F181